ncbi:MAG TPA: type I-E CRISPR-associated protein Cas5/CasD [Sedimentisphaerales bacterium]|nr:type I-E CRISPR-associated protein Cas5/CasD [Sedimentisphaerales bacterium]
MNEGHNTLFLRLAGPMQAWGTSSRFQLRRTDEYPSKSGVLGILLCAKGVRREDSRKELERLASLVMGVRIDRCGTPDWDYHTVGAKIGIRSADGKIKRTASTGEFETVLSRRQYLYDASFLVAFQGDPDIVLECANVLTEPVWPIFLGRKCCVPSEPVFAGTGSFATVTEALEAIEWRPRISALDHTDGSPTRTLPVFIEHLPGSPPPDGAKLVHDVPQMFGYYNHGPRWVFQDDVTVAVGETTQRDMGLSDSWRAPYGPGWDDLKSERLKTDNYLCVFCKSAATDVHHLDYVDVRVETLRSVCKICHKACSMLEYARDMRRKRIDPSDPEQHDTILRQIKLLFIK